MSRPSLLTESCDLVASGTTRGTLWGKHWRDEVHPIWDDCDQAMPHIQRVVATNRHKRLVSQAAGDKDQLAGDVDRVGQVMQ